MSTTVLSGSLNQEFCAANEEQSSDHDLTRQPFSLLMTSSQHNLLENQGLVDESYFSASSISSTSSPVSHQPVANDTPRLSSQVSPSSFASPLSLESALGSNSEEYGEGELSRIIHDLIEVHEHNICPDTRFTPEEVLEEQKACYVSKTLRCLLWKINNYNVSSTVSGRSEKKYDMDTFKNFFFSADILCLILCLSKFKMFISLLQRFYFNMKFTYYFFLSSHLIHSL